MNWSRVRTVAAPAFRQDVQQNYPGVFVVQLAGNSGGDGCLTDAANSGASYSYRPRSYAAYSVDDDGIVVVRAVHHTGEAVSDSLPFSNTYPTGLAGLLDPSNFGRCAYLADTLGLTTPAQIEQSVRQNSVQFNGNVDPSGLPVKIIQLP